MSESELWQNLVGFSGEQIRWVKAKAALTARAADRVILRDFNVFTRILVSSVAKLLTPHPPGG
ncbi:MAG: hypothetical protein GY861_11130 [bacterium]|nr:hypothetical protein [bacterium]